MEMTLKFVFANVILVTVFYIAYMVIKQDSYYFEYAHANNLFRYEINKFNSDGLKVEGKGVELTDCVLKGEVALGIGASDTMIFKTIECGEPLLSDDSDYYTSIRHKGCM